MKSWMKHLFSRGFLSRFARLPRQPVGRARRFRYRMDRRSRHVTWVVTITVLLLLIGFQFIWGGTYLPAWIISVVFCLILLYILSIPQFILVDDEALEIHCTLELTHIPMEDIEVIREADPHEFRKLIPLVASYGFGGYYGYYFDLGEWTMYKVYATERQNLVYIEDIYEESYLVSCSDPQVMIDYVLEARDRRRAAIFEHTQLKNNHNISEDV